MIFVLMMRHIFWGGGQWGFRAKSDDEAILTDNKPGQTDIPHQLISLLNS